MSLLRVFLGGVFEIAFAIALVWVVLEYSPASGNVILAVLIGTAWVAITKVDI